MPIVVSTDFTVFEDETYSNSDGTPLFSLESNVLGPFTFLNFGTVSAAGTSAEAFTCWNAFGLLDNRGSVLVTAQTGAAWGLYCPNWSPDIDNSGLWSVSSGGVAVGLETWSVDVSVENSNDWFATTTGAFGYAVGMQFHNGATIVNDGDIIATAPDSSQLLENCTAIDVGSLVSLNNSGNIIANGVNSIGVAMSGFAYSTTPLITNSGTITADTAILVYADGQLVPRLALLNTGTIN